MSQLDKDFTRRLAFLLVETLFRRRRLSSSLRGTSMDQDYWSRMLKSASTDIRNLLRYSDRHHAIACLRAAVKHYREQRSAL
jgi:hypothetical protein